MNREAILCERNHNGVVFTTIMENCNGKIVIGKITIDTRNSCEMCCDTLKNKDKQESVKIISQSIMLESHCRKLIF